MNCTRNVAGQWFGRWWTAFLVVPVGLVMGGEPQWVSVFDGAGPPRVAPRGVLPLVGNSATTKDGLLHLVDRSTAGGSTLLYAVLWNADPQGVTECEAEVQLIAASPGPCGMCLDVADGIHEDSLSFYPDGIGLWYAKLQHKMDTRDSFHAYRVRIAGDDIQVFVDGQLAIDGKGKFTTAAENGRNECQFGAGSSPDTGEALWRKMRFQIRPIRETKLAVPHIPGLDVHLGDNKTPGDDYPASFHFNKYRTIVVFSSDKGKTWGNPITVATQPRPAQEGCCEADLVRAANGGILCAMRSGGSMGKFTPCYLCRSSDEGQTWSTPQAILDRGVWPALCVTRSGVMVCTTGRPGNWLTFSRDDGRTTTLSPWSGRSSGPDR